MTDFLRVTCSCGCENWVSRDRAGQSVVCTVCGNVLRADPVQLGPALDHPASITDQLDALHREQNRARSVFIESAAVRDGFTDETCTRCGKELRGDWDRAETAAGVICYICSNQATEGIPERLKARITEQSRSRPRRPRPVSAENLPPMWRNPRRHLWKGWITRSVAVALSVLIFSSTVYFLFFNAGAPLPATDGGVAIPSAISARDLADLPTGMWVLARAWLIVSVILPVFVALYLMLLLNNSFPKKGTLNQCAFVALACSPILAIQLAQLLVETVFWNKGTLLVFASLMLAMLQLLAVLGIFFELVEESIWQCAGFVLFLQVISRVAMPYVNLLLFRALGIL